MAGVNRVYLVGRIVAEPTLRITPRGIPVVDFTLSVERRHASSKIVYNAPCVMVGKGVKNACKVLKLRTLLHVDGFVQHSEIDDSTEIFVHSFTILQWVGDAPALDDCEDVVDYD